MQNIRVVAKYYRRISIQKFAQLLDLTPQVRSFLEQTEQSVDTPSLIP